MKSKVKERVTMFSFDGKEYPLKLTFNVIADIQDEFGDIESFLKAMDRLRNQIWLLCVLLNEAVDIHNDEHEEQWEHFTESQVGRKINVKDIEDIANCIYQVLELSFPESDGEETEKNETAE